MVAIGSRVWAWPSPMPFDRPREARLNDVFADRDLGFRQLREIRTDSQTHDLGLDPGSLVWLFPFSFLSFSNKTVSTFSFSLGERTSSGNLDESAQRGISPDRICFYAARDLIPAL